MSKNMTWRRNGGGSEKKGVRFKGNQKKWKAACEELLDSVYTVGGEGAADRYNKTAEKLLMHVTANYTYGNDIASSLRDLQHMDLTKEKPIQPENAGTDRFVCELLKNEVKQYSSRVTYYKTNMSKVFGLILGQCHPTLKTRLKAQVPDWSTFVQKADPVHLLKYVKEQTHDMQAHKFPLVCQRDALEDIFGGLKPKEGESLSGFKERYEARVETMESLGARPDLTKFLQTSTKYKTEYEEAVEMDLHEHVQVLEAVARVEQDDAAEFEEESYYVSLGEAKKSDLIPKNVRVKEIEEKWYKKLIALNFLHALSKKGGKYVELMNDLENSWGEDNDAFPADLDAALTKATTFKSLKAGRDASNDGGRKKGKRTAEEANLAQPEGAAKKKSKIRCWLCNAEGHTKAECPLNPESSNYNKKIAARISTFQAKHAEAAGDSTKEE